MERPGNVCTPTTPDARRPRQAIPASTEIASLPLRGPYRQEGELPLRALPQLAELVYDKGHEDAALGEAARPIEAPLRRLDALHRAARLGNLVRERRRNVEAHDPDVDGDEAGRVRDVERGNMYVYILHSSAW